MGSRLGLFSYDTMVDVIDALCSPFVVQTLGWIYGHFFMLPEPFTKPAERQKMRKQHEVNKKQHPNPHFEKLTSNQDEVADVRLAAVESHNLGEAPNIGCRGLFHQNRVSENEKNQKLESPLGLHK